MLTSRLRIGLAAAAVCAFVAAPYAQAGTDAPAPCSVSYSTHDVVNDPVVTHFTVSCNGDEVSSLEQSTSMQWPVSGRSVDCRTATAGSSSSLPCTGPTAKRLQPGVATLAFTAYGNFLSCADDGACDPEGPLTHPSCVTSVVRDLTGSDPSTVLTCSYRVPLIAS